MYLRPPWPGRPLRRGAPRRCARPTPVVKPHRHPGRLLVRARRHGDPLDLLPEPGHIQAAIALARRPVSAVMVSPCPRWLPTPTCAAWRRCCWTRACPGLPVTDEYGVPGGFVSRTDILRAVAADPPWTCGVEGAKYRAKTGSKKGLFHCATSYR